MGVSKQKMRIIVASRDRSSNKAIGMLIDAQPDLELVGTAQDILDVLDEAKSNCPDLVVVDWEMLGRQLDAVPDFIELLDLPLRIVVMSVNERAQASVLAYGVDGFVYKGDPPQRLLETIRTFSQEKKFDFNSNGKAG